MWKAFKNHQYKVRATRRNPSRVNTFNGFTRAFCSVVISCIFDFYIELVSCICCFEVDLFAFTIYLAQIYLFIYLFFFFGWLVSTHKQHLSIILSTPYKFSVLIINRCYKVQQHLMTFLYLLHVMRSRVKSQSLSNNMQVR
jgi:hypothetical protein